MPDTALSWGPSILANGITTGRQWDPDITLLASGTIVVSWTTEDNTPPAHPQGNNVIGRRFDQLGAVIPDAGTSGFHFNFDDLGTNYSQGAIGSPARGRSAGRHGKGFKFRRLRVSQAQ